MTPPLILISNDDSINSNGIKLLIDVAKQFGEVLVVAPHSPASAQSHAITIASPIRLHENNSFGDNIKAYSCTGTPADCIKIAKNHLLKDRKPDLVLSGVNHGSNSSISVIYSGTMAAAIEAAIDNIPAIGFSLCDYDHNGYMEHAKSIMANLIKKTIEKGLPPHTALNVNFPAYNGSEIKGMKVCRQAKAKWEEAFDERKDPYNGTYFWMAGDFKSLDNGEDTDEQALNDYYASIVPCQFDFTAYNHLNQIEDLIS